MSLEQFMPDAVALYELNAVQVASSDFLAQVGARRAPAQLNSDTRIVREAAVQTNAVRPKEIDRVSENCRKTVSSADAALALLDELDRKHKDISTRTSLLHAECKRLVDDESRMRTMAQRIYNPLTYFESLFIIGRRLGTTFPDGEVEQCANVLQEMQKLNGDGARPGNSSAGNAALARAGITHGWNPHRVRILDMPLSPEDEDFPAALDRIDECIASLATHVTYAESKEFIARYKDLQSKAVDMVLAKLKIAVNRVAVSAAADIRAAQAAVAEAASASDAPPRALSVAMTNADAVEISALQLRWRTELSSLRLLLSLIETRAASKRVYMAAAKACYAIYAAARIAAVAPVAAGRLERAVHDITNPLRVAAGAPKGALLSRHGAGVGQGSASQGTVSVAGRGARDTDGSSVHTTYTSGTTGTRGTMLFGPEVSSRESCVVDAVRTCAALLARVVSGEHALFHAIFTTSGGGRSGTSTARTAMQGWAMGDDVDAVSVSGPSRRDLQASLSASVARSERTAITRGTTTLTTAAGLTVGGMPASVRAAADAALSAMCDELCIILQDSLQSPLRALASLDSLVDIVTVLRDEVIREVAAPRGPALAPLARAANNLMSDVRERLAFRASSFIQDYLEKRQAKREVAVHRLMVNLPVTGQAEGGFVPATICVRGELDYPAKLVSFYLRQRTAEAAEACTRAALDGENTTTLLPDPALTIPPPIYDAWLPVVEDTLLLIAKLHSALERSAFEGLAREAVQACARSVIDAGAAVRAAASKHAGAADTLDEYLASRLEGPVRPPGSLLEGLSSAAVRLQDPCDPTASAAVTASLDGCLLVVKSLLTLREQLSPYEMDPVLTQSSLDFRPTGQALADIVAGLADRSIFSLTSGNPLLGLFTKGLPSMAEQRIDVRAALEAALRAAAEEAVAVCTHMLSKHLVVVIGPGQLKDKEKGAPGAAVDGKMYAAHMSQAIIRTRGTFTSLLPALRRRFGLYLGSPTTASILWRPVREQAAHILIAARAHAAEALGTGSEERLWLDACLGVLLSDLETVTSVVIDPLDARFGMDAPQWRSIPAREQVQVPARSNDAASR